MSDSLETNHFTTPDPTLAVGSVHQGFVVTAIEAVPELSATAYLMRHEATAARLLWLACADTNRAFSIAFKTPPADDTGVFHILEHSVLCGSDRFPVKEPFVNLIRTSMQTFLNALTFPDKTMYPVSSTNVADFENLMDVYLDAVLHPAIYHRPRIFEQEGWHFELGEGDDAPLTYNGVVFNEMKGALSDPDDVLYQAVCAQLFPDTAYGFESGGNPRAIPTLTYEQFLNTHARHYNLPNSYTQPARNAEAPQGGLRPQGDGDRAGERLRRACLRGGHLRRARARAGHRHPARCHRRLQRGPAQARRSRR